MGNLRKRPGRYWLPPIFFTIVLCLFIWDHAYEVHEGLSVMHVVIEALMMLVVIIGALYFWIRLLKSRKLQKQLAQQLQTAQDRIQRFQREEHDLIRNLNKAIERQFDEWDLNPTERDIAWCLLKGMSMKDIAEHRGSTNHSVRQQAYVLYQKAGLAGRVELSAFFLGGLMHFDADPGAEEPGSQATEHAA